MRVPLKVWPTVAPAYAVSIVSSTSCALSPVAASACGSSSMAMVGVPLCRLNCRSTMPGILAERRDDLIADRVERVQIIAEDLDRHLRGLAAQALADAIAEERHYFALYARVVRQDLAQLLLCIGLIDRGIRLELDVKFAAMRSPGILAQFRAADLLFDALHVGQRQHLGADALAHASISSSEVPGDRNSTPA